MMSRVDRTSPLSPDSRQRRFRIVVIVVSVVAAIAGSAFLAIRDSSEKATTRAATVTLPVQGHPGAVIAGPDALWVALSDSQETAGEGRVARLDLVTGAQARSVYLGGKVSHLARVGHRLIASLVHPSGLTELAALEWGSGKGLTRRFFDPPVDQIVLRGTELWALEVRPGGLLRLDSGTLEP